MIAVCPDRFTDSNANLICKELGRDKAVDWFGISDQNADLKIDDGKINTHLRLEEMLCNPDANDVNNCTYVFNLRLGVCAGLELSTIEENRNAKIPRINDQHVVIVCNPKPGELSNTTTKLVLPLNYSTNRALFICIQGTKINTAIKTHSNRIETYNLKIIALNSRYE